jgi:putative ABC transport system permease protein
VKALLTVIGIASSCAILIMGLFFSDSYDHIIRIQYGVAQREDLTVSFIEPTSTAALYELKGERGVLHAEAFRSVAVRLRREHRSYKTGIEGIPQDAYLRRIIDKEFRPISIPRQGIVLTQRLGEILHAGPGDEIVVEVLEGHRRTRRVRVVALAQQYIGMAAYMDLQALNRLVGGQAISGVYMTTDMRYEPELVQALRRRPRVASIVAQNRAIAAFMETTAESMLTFTYILSLFAGIIAFGVVYNSARIALSERDRELASLRVLGFTRGEIAYILLGELAVIVLVSLPIGFGLGSALSAFVVAGVQTDLYEIPLVLSRGTFALAAVVVLASAVVSAVIVRLKLNKLDLIGVLKTRE